MIKYLSYLFLAIVLTFYACSNTKYLPKGEKLYTGGQVDIKNNDITKNETTILKGDLEGLLRPKPNGSFLGLRPKLYLWNITQTKKKKGLKAWLHKQGEPPVLVSSVDLNANSQILTNRLQNVSYFQASVTGDTISKGRTAKAVYTANTGPGYKIRKVVFPAGTSHLDTAVAGTAKYSLLKVGDNYNLDVIKNERVRIDARLKEEGFYYFAPEDLIMQIDSTIANHQVDIFVKVKDATPDKARNIYTINKIYVYPEYNLRDTSLKLDSAEAYRWFYIIDPKHTMSPWAFKNTVLLHPNEVYNRTAHTKSLNRFIELGPFKFVKNRFEDVSTADSPKLNVFYQLTKYPKKSLQFETLFRTTSANYNGTQVNLSYKNRNLFGGAELLTVTLFGSTDGQIGGQNGGYPLSQVGGQATLSWPRFITPFKDFKNDNAFIPHTNLTFGYAIVNRKSLYNLNSYNASFGYQWKENLHRTHDLTVLGITYVNPQNVTPVYDSISRVSNDPSFRHVIDPQFTWGPSYHYTYDNTTETSRKNSIFYRGGVSLSNNILGLVTGADTLKGKVKTLFGTPFSQYIKFDNEIRYFHKTGPNATIATRVFAGFGIPYGNSTIIPYSQQFFIGGANSLRGFRARSVGPGTVDAAAAAGPNGFLPDQSGDIKLEANVEYRPKLFSIVYGALFVDAGNIWNLNSHQPGDKFTANFLSQMAVDAGVGLRFDVTVLVLRTDLGFPLIKPWLPVGQRAVSPSFHDAIFNIAIGYPF
ncbi:translocation and assembly module lipoprotein TamL [Mucilaginibacter ginkgonis]|uniref:BamA/TamA family outer membrane protein n=1 Tax=Mucilaginibacter ginkgonis TaxID=2682091 RepID=A0A7T7JFM9_9SPHI|nr:BamA/TamA family outer membrane protein [Mucilaginibacter ginkgonis]QQL48249.1 BamA/TamA family outer membrane protein [Mucilaginibacter ginkgonis]